MGNFELITPDVVSLGDFYLSQHSCNRELGFQPPRVVVGKIGTRVFEIAGKEPGVSFRVSYNELGAGGYDAILLKNDGSGRVYFSRSFAEKLTQATETEDFRNLRETMAEGAASEGLLTRCQDG
ncbi:hypothetical protein A3K73_09340 [Candidatus Pacearchaeota archaeon RBG_13_36_9]|nr:MAG: hypothetical protein A3K73_09340 [Candidatus Pacearchaeota archaeon RBG_13_36_9]